MEKQPDSRMCFVCGIENLIGLHLKCYTDDEGRCIARFRPKPEHQGFPGQLHGGLISTLLNVLRGGVGRMRIAKVVALLGLLAMTGVLIYGFTIGDFAGEGKQLLSMPWGIVSLVDLYVGFVLFSGWIVYREKSAARSIVWVILMMVLGFWTASLYTLIALQTSGGDWKRFWMGRRAGGG